jgi:hypothetical protein
MIEAIEHRTGVRVVWGVAGFPVDAINFDDLMDAAVSRFAYPLLEAEKKDLASPRPESVEVH